MVTLFHVTGAYVYVQPDGGPVGIEDVFTKLAAARAHYEAVGLRRQLCGIDSSASRSLKE